MYDTTIRLLVILLIVVWCLMILYPFTNVLLWSLILAMAMYPGHKRLSEFLGGKRKLASAIIVLLSLCIILLPSWFVIDSLITEFRGLKAGFQTGGLSIPPPEPEVKEWPIIGERIFDIWNGASQNLKEFIDKYREQLVRLGRRLTSGILGTVGAILQITLSFFIASVLLVFEGISESMRKFFRKLAGKRGDEFADITMATVSSVLKGVLGVAFSVALLHGIIFLLAGVPYPGLWALVVFVLGVLQLPAILVTLPIVLYLFAVKSTAAAVIYTVLLVVAGLSDNVLKPILLGKGAPVPTLVIFLGVVGGFIFSGFIGLFTGAIVMSLGYKLFMGWMNSGEDTVEVSDHA